MSRFMSAMVMASALAASPAVAQSGQVRAITPTEKQQGATANPQLIKEFGGAYTGPQAAYVERVGKKIAVQSGLSRSGGDFTVTTLNSPIENAFAIPGGYIYITRQLLALMNSEDELASVLGHEVAHVAARHSTSRNQRATIGSILAAGAGVLTGSDLAARAIGTGAQLYTLRYGREQEYQADSLGIRYMTTANYDPYASAYILDALDTSTKLAAQAAGQSGRSVPTWASTHPNGQDRVDRAYSLAEQTGRRPTPSSQQDTTFLRMLDGLPYGAVDSKTVIRIVTVGPQDTIASLAARMRVQQLPRERFLTLNGLAADQPLRPGMLVKLVVAA